MRVRKHVLTHTEQARRCHSLVNHVFIKGDLTVILLIDIQVLHQALMKEILKGSAAKNSVLIWSYCTHGYLQKHVP